MSGEVSLDGFMQVASLIFFVFIAAGMFVLFRFLSKIADKQKDKIAAAAAANGMTYWKGPSEDRYAKSTMLGMQQAYVDNGLISTEGIDVGSAFFGDTEHSVGFDFIAVQLPYDTRLHLLIDSRRNNVLGRTILDTANAKAGMDKLELEADFPKSYEVYEEPGKQISTLMILNPKSMEQLIISFQQYDIELAADKVYLYSLATTRLENTAGVGAVLEDGRRMKQFMTDNLPRPSDGL